jgi:hypothetical protein
MPPTEVFISCAGADRAFAEELAGVLRRHSVKCWHSGASIPGGEQWHDEIGDALQRCDWFLVVASESALNSMWTRRELLFALQESRLNNRIVPLLLSPCDYVNLSWVLRSVQLIDFQTDRPSGYRRLLALWEIPYQPGVEAR